jgi:signal transduction histidine kinase/CheY-like chemotaxis protein
MRDWGSWFAQRVIPLLPERFQEGKMPYAVLFGLLIIGVMLVFAWISPYAYGTTVPLVAAAALAVQIYCLYRGMSLSVAVHLATALGAVQIVFAAWVSGGIFSPRLAWLLILPITPFFVIGRRSGYVWFVLVVLIQLAVTALTGHGQWLETFDLGVQHAASSLTTFALVTCVMIIVPLIYDHQHRKALAEVEQRQQELEKKRQELVSTVKAREQFIATVSHELRTPMNAILGFNTLLLNEATDKPRARQILEHTRQSADHLMTVINDVLDFSQFDAGRLTARAETFALRETVQHAVDLFLPRVKSMHLSFRCEIDPDVPEWVSTDRHRLMQILVNLIGNAIKFTHEGHVLVKVSTEASGVMFSVQDTGIGIAPEQQSQVFKRFIQAESDIQKRYGGNGLGLTISQRLVELLGGDMGFESELGKGSHFWFRLPVKAMPAPVRTPEVTAALQTPGASWRFLVVDDHPINRLLVKQVLKQAWPQSLVDEADDGQSAIDRLQTDAYDVVFMDMVMPVMDGIETSQWIRRELDTPASQTPILGLTANVNPVDLDRFVEAGLSGVMLKPFEPSQLCAKVEELLAQKLYAPAS